MARIMRDAGFFGEDALASINAVSEHSCTDGLHAFLEMNLPRIKRKKVPAFALGVIDPNLVDNASITYADTFHFNWEARAEALCQG